MGFLDRFKKKEEEVKKEETENETFLRVCGGEDTTDYKALYNTLNLSPEPIRIAMNELVERAEKFEKEGDIRKAISNYHYAGQLALYHAAKKATILPDDIKKIKEYFGEEEKLRKEPGRYPLIQEGITEEVMKKAQEFYKEREIIEKKSKRY